MLAVTVVRGKYWRQRAPMRRLAIAQEMDFLHARLWCIILLSKQRKRLLQPKKCAFCRARRSSSPRCPSRMFVHGVVEPHPTQDDFPYTNSAGRSASTVLVPVQAAQLALLATASLYEIYAAVHECVTGCGCAS